MSYPTQRAALKAGTHIKRLLNKPAGWKVTTLDNGGWHWTLHNGPISLHESSDSEVFALMSRKVTGGAGGLPDWTQHYTHANPNKVVARQVKTARTYLNVLTASVEHAESVL